MSQRIDSESTTRSEAHQPERLLRASDADRHATVMVIQEAVSRGLLTPDEGSERMSGAYAAVNLHELDPLTADLPPAPIVRTRRGWRGVVATAVALLLLWLRGLAGRPRRRRLVVVVVLIVVLMVVGLGAVDLIFGGGRPDAGGFDPRGLGHR